MSAPEDHEVLDLIAERLNGRDTLWDASRESECVEFFDPTKDQWFEIIVRAIEVPSREDGESGTTEET